MTALETYRKMLRTDFDEDAAQLIDDYARIQIEKHMERVKAQIAYDDGATTIEDSFNIVPIDLG